MLSVATELLLLVLVMLEHGEDTGTGVEREGVTAGVDDVLVPDSRGGVSESGTSASRVHLTSSPVLSFSPSLTKTSPSSLPVSRL